MPRLLLLVGSAAVQAAALVKLRPPYLPGLGFFTTFALMAAFNLTIWIFYCIAIYPDFVSPLRHLPSPKTAHPVFGHSGSQVKYPRGEDYLNYMRDIPNDGLIRLKGPFGADEVLPTNAKSLADVLVAQSYDFPKPERSRNFLRISLGDGLVVVEGADHKRQRKNCLPSFGFRQIKELYPLHWAKAVQMVKAIDQKTFGAQGSNAQPVPRKFGNMDVEHWIIKAALDIIGVAGLGRDFNTLKNSDDQIAVLYEELNTPSPDMDLLATLLLTVGSRIAGLVCWRAARRIKEIVTNLRIRCEQFVREKKRQMANPDDKSVDVLARLIKTGAFTDRELVDQLLTFLAAGHETTSSAFTWVLYLMTAHPDVQKRLRHEIRTALPAGLRTLEETPNFDLGTMLESLPLLNGVCNETLRLFPTVPVTARVSKNNTTVLGQYIPAGTRFFIVPWAINKDPTVWGPDALEFKPERWIDADTGKPNQTGGAPSNYSFLTFLHGPRSCIGQGFAKSELRSLVAAFIGTYECTLANPGEKVLPAGMVTTKPRGGLKITISKPGDW